MRKLKIALLALLGLSAVCVVGGYALPSKVHLETEARLSSPPTTVFEVLNTFDGQKVWWEEAVKAYADEGMPPLEVVHAGGPPAGQGMQIEFLSDGDVAEQWKVLSATAPDTITYEVDFQIFVVERTLTLEPDGDGTKVTWSEDGEFSNPLVRYMTLMPSEDVIKNFDNALVALEKVTAPESG